MDEKRTSPKVSTTDEKFSELHKERKKPHAERAAG